MAGRSAVDRRSVGRLMTVWAVVGMLVAIGWVAYALATAPDIEIPLSRTEQLIRGLAYFTCPAVFFGASFPWVIPANGVTYALIGLLVDLLLRLKERPPSA